MKKYPFPSSCRIRSSWEFDVVFRTGQRIQGRLVRFVYVEAPDGISRYGVAAGKRLGSAPRRNRGKRMVREVLRHIRPWICEGFWMIVMLRQRGLGVHTPALCREMVQLLESKKLLREDWPGNAWNLMDFPETSVHTPPSHPNLSAGDFPVSRQ